MATSDDDAPLPPKTFEEMADGETASRTAAHEAGHILTLWLSWAVASVDGTAFILDGKDSLVRVHKTYKAPHHPIQLWEALVVSAAGMAGEVVTHITFNTGNCRHDLEGMRTQVELITKAFGPSPKPRWAEPADHKAPPFETYFKDGLPPGAGDLMRSAYRRAKDVILQNRSPFERLRTALLVKMEMTTAEIGAALRIPKA